MIEKLIKEMTKYYHGDPKRIQHFLKVYAFVGEIGVMENLDEKTLFILNTAAVVHDIGIRYCEETYGECGGKLQEKEGPHIADEMLRGLGYEENVIERVKYLIAHHHTYDEIEGIDYQILVEADFLVNIYEDEFSTQAAKHAYERIFKTETGKFLCQEMFNL